MHWWTYILANIYPHLIHALSVKYYGRSEETIEIDLLKQALEVSIKIFQIPINRITISVQNIY